MSNFATDSCHNCFNLVVLFIYMDLVVTDCRLHSA